MPPSDESPSKPYRPARPPICLIWEVDNSISLTPFHLRDDSKMIRFIFL